MEINMTPPLNADEKSALSKLMTILKPLRDFTMSRGLRYLTDIDRRGKPGLGRVVRSQLYDRRSVASKPTPKSNAIVGQITAAIMPAVRMAA
jgi:hypothetical protein